MTEQTLFKADPPVGSYQIFPGEQVQLLLKRARVAAVAPTPFTGCLSELCCAERLDRDAAAGDYAAALKYYGAVCEAAQSYLAPGDVVAHDYALCMRCERDAHGAQLAAETELGVAEWPDAPSFSDEEVESCGYLGWLRN